MRFSLRVAAKIVSFMIIVFSCAGCTGNDISSGPLAPDFSLTDLSGRMISLKQNLGRVVLLDFWATWCGPCRMTIPELIKVSERYERNDVIVLGVSLDDPRTVTNQQLLTFKERSSINYPVLRYNRKVIQDYFGNESISIPAMFIIDREGRIRDKIVGFKSGVIEQALDRLLK